MKSFQAMPTKGRKKIIVRLLTKNKKQKCERFQRQRLNFELQQVKMKDRHVTPKLRRKIAIICVQFFRRMYL